MYRPKEQGKQEQEVRRSGRRGYVSVLLRVLTGVFWASAVTFVALMALYALTKSVGTATTWATGVSLALMAVCSGAITWVELKSNPLDDTERGEWTNKMLFYGLMCVFSFIVACLYLPALYFAP